MHRLAELEHKVSDASLQQLPEFKQRVAVLQRLDYIDESDTVQMKACGPYCKCKRFVIAVGLSDACLSWSGWVGCKAGGTM